jgi:hypothetical protein
MVIPSMLHDTCKRRLHLKVDPIVKTTKRQK